MLDTTLGRGRPEISGSRDLDARVGYVAILGVLTAGAAYVPIDHGDPPARAQQILRAAAACAVIASELTVKLLGPAGYRLGEPAPEDDAWIIFTSGSSGAPKGVAVTHRAAASFVDAEQELFGGLPRRP